MFGISLAFLIGHVLAKTVVYNFNITEEIIAPDLTNQKTVLVNKMFPGPEIRAKPFDTIIVHLYNNHPENFTMHFHGLDQKGSNDADGVPFVTQYPIPPGGYYKYKINVGDQSGTYWYHSHVSYQSTTAFGPIIIEDENWNDIIDYNSKYSYDEELVILFSDIFHKTDKQVEKDISGKVFMPEDSIKSILINGQTFAERNQTVSELNPLLSNSSLNFGNKIFNVEPGKKYRVRFIGATSVGLLTCKINNHEMLIIETDGVLSEPIMTDRLVINSGQRYSAIITFDKAPNNYWAHCSVEEREDPLNGNFVFHYNNSPSAQLLSFVKPELMTISETNDWIINNITTSEYYTKQSKYRHYGSKYLFDFPKKVDKRIFLDLRARAFNESFKYALKSNVAGGDDTMSPVIDTKNIQEGIFKVNETNFAISKTPVIERLRSKNFTEFPGIYQVNEGDSVEVILQNYAGGDGSCFEHPWHLHGHPFYVVENGGGEYKNVTKIPPKMLVRDTDTLYRSPKKNYNAGEACGYKVVRFVANNPGAWIMHCHITYHMVMGMQLVFMVIPSKEKEALLPTEVSVTLI